jgi:hypothetical protein
MNVPFAQTWTEELVAEWLQLDGYVVEIGLPVSITSAGGRFCADVVGARINGNQLEIMHVEVGQLAGGGSSIASLKKKFSTQNQQSIEQYFIKRFGFSHGNIVFEKMYVASFSTGPVIQGAQLLGVQVHPLEDFIKSHVLPTIAAWKKIWQSKGKGSDVTLSGADWLLQMIDFLSVYGLLK